MELMESFGVITPGCHKNYIKERWALPDDYPIL